MWHPKEPLPRAPGLPPALSLRAEAGAEHHLPATRLSAPPQTCWGALKINKGSGEQGLKAQAATPGAASPSQCHQPLLGTTCGCPGGEALELGWVPKRAPLPRRSVGTPSHALPSPSTTQEVLPEPLLQKKSPKSPGAPRGTRLPTGTVPAPIESPRGAGAGGEVRTARTFRSLLSP